MPQLSSTMTYDHSNRMVEVANSNGGEAYIYAPDSRRVWRSQGVDPITGNAEQVMLYSPGGQLMGVYRVAVGTFPSGATVITKVQENVYWGGRRIYSPGTGRKVTDRLSSVGNGSTYYPYGEYKASGSTNGGTDTEQFATYKRDGKTGLDYADQRYYAAGLGRFASFDPYSGSVGIGEPQSWNRFTYVLNDPVSLLDPFGLSSCAADTPTVVNVCSTFFPITVGGSGGGGGGGDSSGMQVVNDTLPVIGGGGTNPVVTGDGHPPTQPVGPSQWSDLLNPPLSIGSCPYGQQRMANGTCDVPLNSNAIQILQVTAQTTAVMSTPTPYIAWTGASALVGAALAGSGAMSGSSLFTLGDAQVPLFRAVQDAELAQLSSTGMFQQVPNSTFLGKYFADTFLGAAQYARMAGTAFSESYTIVGTTIAFRLLTGGGVVDRGIATTIVPPSFLPNLAMPVIYPFIPLIP
jgi:RHS repeat-associated protein